MWKVAHKTNVTTRLNSGKRIQLIKEIIMSSFVCFEHYINSLVVCYRKNTINAARSDHVPTVYYRFFGKPATEIRITSRARHARVFTGYSISQAGSGRAELCSCRMFQ